MPAGARLSFTTKDDQLLAKYLAKYNPGLPGRSGNKIYQVLAENEDNKWPWSVRHPWGGWRDRYVKNQREFNMRIKKYQRENGLPMENPHWINGTQKLEGLGCGRKSLVLTRTRNKGGRNGSGRVHTYVETRKRVKRDPSEEPDELDNDNSATGLGLGRSTCPRVPDAPAHTSPTSIPTSPS
ncbi:hypothetical protein B0H16DRAFT_584037 [Mycena metata]|uniref:TERF2-interacting telomeric protein 1 Myb domain-containing protein n=1 Tax=Mycena metata TaxID=1033252 RepID=A0AAD7MDG9_9AGAR|nr:hypothetical protein B0H16DRAFT_584037 [Mycena metata]